MVEENHQEGPERGCRSESTPHPPPPALAPSSSSPSSLRLYRRMLLRIDRFLAAHEYWRLVFTFPPRVFGAALLTLWLLRTHHGPLSVPCFFAGFLFYNLLSAPSTGQPNALDVLIARAFAYVFAPAAARPAPSSTVSSNNHHPQQQQQQQQHAHAHAHTRIMTRHKSSSLRFSIRRVHVHLHHWLYLLLLYLASLLLHNVFAMFPSLRVWWWRWSGEWLAVTWTPDESMDMWAGFMLGGCVQGFKYADWSHVLWLQQESSEVGSTTSSGSSTLSSEAAAAASSSSSLSSASSLSCNLFASTAAEARHASMSSNGSESEDGSDASHSSSNIMSSSEDEG